MKSTFNTFSWFKWLWKNLEGANISWLVINEDIYKVLLFLRRSARNAWRISRFRLYWIKVTKPPLFSKFLFFIRRTRYNAGLEWSYTLYFLLCFLSFISANAFRSQFLFLPEDDEFTVLLFSKVLSGNQSFIACLLYDSHFILIFFSCCE